MKETRYQSDDPRQIDLEEAIAERGGRPYTPGPRQAVAFGADGVCIGVEQRRMNRDYRSLKEVLDRAYLQAAMGKGKERHANGQPFEEQPIMQIAAAHGIGFATGQAAKKSQEAIGMFSRDQHEAAQRELLGAIVYLAAAYLHVAQAKEIVDKSGVDQRGVGE